MMKVQHGRGPAGGHSIAPWRTFLKDGEDIKTPMFDAITTDPKHPAILNVDPLHPIDARRIDFPNRNAFGKALPAPY